MGGEQERKKREGSHPPALRSSSWPPLSDSTRAGLRIVQSLLDPRDSIFLSMWRRALGRDVIPHEYHKAVVDAWDWISTVVFLAERGRAPKVAERRGRKINRWQRAEIMEALREGKMTQKEIAEKYNLSRSWISRLKTRMEVGGDDVP